MTGRESELLQASRRGLPQPPWTGFRKEAEEGGCGVIGLASTLGIEGGAISRSCGQMRNRGNGKGGGICAAGLDPAQLGVDRATLEDRTLLQIAYLDVGAREAIEREFVKPVFDVAHQFDAATLEDHRELSLPVRPPEVRHYFVRVRPQVLADFVAKSGLASLPARAVEDEFVYQNSYRLNHKHYASLGEKQAFVLSHGRNMALYKLVGYAEDAVAWYKLDRFKAQVWIGHQRYPTKGRVWHPGGAHPFIGLNEALVHNGDFANYARVAKYLKQRNITPLFLTDTEVSVQLFDLWTRTYRYPLEYAIEAMAPTTERDFFMLPPEKQIVYRALQSASIKGSPDGPWFFIIARSDPSSGARQLIGVTDTSMLRPQVFALQDRGGERIAMIASEKQAIDACLESLSAAGTPFAAPADRYWNARGGSYSDGGAFVFTVKDGALTVSDKFGRTLDFDGVDYAVERNRLKTQAFLARTPEPGEVRLSWATRGELKPPASPDRALVVDASGFPREGPETLSLFLVLAYRKGWRRLVAWNLSGHRFAGCGFGPGADAVLELYGSSGDYLGSGMDGLTVVVHNSAQDQIGQILKSGRLVIHGDVGQTFMYGAKGGEVYVLGSAAGRPLINAVGKPRVVINGTCLDYLAESFMAGDPLHGGGFVIVNAVKLVGDRKLEPLPTPYPGGNLFSLASGGAIYMRDPEKKVGEDQLNGGRIEALADEDWKVIRPYLEENERLFGIPVEGLLTHQGKKLEPAAAYRKIAPTKLRALVLGHD